MFMLYLSIYHQPNTLYSAVFVPMQLIHIELPPTECSLPHVNHTLNQTSKILEMNVSKRKHTIKLLVLMNPPSLDHIFIDSCVALHLIHTLIARYILVLIKQQVLQTQT